MGRAIVTFVLLWYSSVLAVQHLPDESAVGEIGLATDPARKEKVPASAADQSVHGAKIDPNSAEGADQVIRMAMEREEKSRAKAVRLVYANASTIAASKKAEAGNAKIVEPNPAADSRLPSQCIPGNYAREFLPPVGCTCDKGGCNMKNKSASCSTPPDTPCFGKFETACHAVAKTQQIATNACHESCHTCSPGQDTQGFPSSEACRSCSADRAWVPVAGSKNLAECTLGAQMGACKPYPAPMERCLASCSPASLTADMRLQGQYFVNNNTNNKTVVEQSTAAVPSVACAKACTDAHTVLFDSSPAGAMPFTTRAEATIFCSTYKLVSCKWQGEKKKQSLGDADPGRSTKMSASQEVDATTAAAAQNIVEESSKQSSKESISQRIWQTSWGPSPSSALKGSYICNVRKHAALIGFQLQNDGEFRPGTVFHSPNTTIARKIVQPWMGKDGIINVTGSLKSKPTMLSFHAPAQNGTEANLHKLIIAKSEHVCFKHMLLA